MVLVTGGAGFIGSNIVRALVKQGRFVRVLDDFSTGKRENLDEVVTRIELIEGDLRDLKTVRRAMKGVRHVLHQGAVASVVKSVEDPIGTNAVNAGGTLHVLVAARDEGVKTVVYASSCAIYGDDPALPKQEEMKPAPITPYALQKLASELYCRQFTALHGLETVCLRYFNVYGYRQDPDGAYAAAIPKFLEAILKDRSPVVYGDGEQTRDFVFIDDVVRANLLALEAPDAAGTVVNVASGRECSINELLAILAELFGREITPVHEERRAGDVPRSVADVTVAKEKLGFTAGTSLIDGLGKYISWFQEQAN